MPETLSRSVHSRTQASTLLGESVSHVDISFQNQSTVTKKLKRPPLTHQEAKKLETIKKNVD